MPETGRSGRTRAIKKGPGKSGRIVAPRESEGLSDTGMAEFQEEQSVELLIRSRTEIGYAAVTNGSREGLLYKNEVFQNLRKGSG